MRATLGLMQGQQDRGNVHKWSTDRPDSVLYSYKHRKMQARVERLDANSATLLEVTFQAALLLRLHTIFVNKYLDKRIIALRVIHLVPSQTEDPTPWSSCSLERSKEIIRIIYISNHKNATEIMRPK